MGRPAKKNMVVQITLDKEIVKTMDEVLKILNEQIDTKKEKRFTRSMIIQDSLIMMFYSPEKDGAKLPLRKKKGENNNA